MHINTGPHYEKEEIDISTGYNKLGQKTVENHLQSGILIKMVLFHEVTGKKRYEKRFGASRGSDKEFFFTKEGKIRFEGKFKNCAKTGVGNHYDLTGKTLYKGEF
jgi:antitoxin component YwqK of YwqJK toxin-antitoxin module